MIDFYRSFKRQMLVFNIKDDDRRVIVCDLLVDILGYPGEKESVVEDCMKMTYLRK